MRYTIKNKIVSFGGSSTVRDEAGNDVFFVSGRVFTFTKFKTVRALDRTPLFNIRNRFFNILLPKVYLMNEKGEIILTFKKRKFFSLRQNFDIIPAPGLNLNYTIDGDLIGRHYDILENGVPVAHVRRNFNLVKDSFYLETDLTEKAAFFVAFVIALDNYYDKLQEEDR